MAPQEPLLTTSGIHSYALHHNNTPVLNENFNASLCKTNRNEHCVILPVTTKSLWFPPVESRFVIFDSTSG